MNKEEKNNTIKYKINQVKLPIEHHPDDLKNKVLHQLKIQPKELVSLEILKQSIDARKKPHIFYSYTVIIELDKRTKLPKSLSSLEEYKELRYQPLQKQYENQVQNPCYHNKTSEPFTNPPEHSLPPIIVGTGPAGLFCGYLLALAGLNPILLERGVDVDQRILDVEEFWKTGTLKLDSNVQFGEGGAGTFSDGKLNTLVKDKLGRNRFVLETLVEHGAPKEILFEQKPHMGTDILVTVVKNVRKSIEGLGGRFEFNTKLVDLDNRALFADETNTSLNLITINPTKPNEPPVIYSTNHLVLAIGHSARDTFEMLHRKNIEMSAKPFAVGLRIEHPQKVINDAQYGPQHSTNILPAASYKLAENLDNGRGVYSFCMCPGGVVVNASTEEGALAINGMSYHARDGKNANSAVVVTVSPDDYPSRHPLSGIEFQRELEKKAFEIGEGKIPVQKFEDFLSGCHLPNMTEILSADSNLKHSGGESLTSNPNPCNACSNLEEFTPNIKGQWQYANLTSLFSPELRDSLGEGILRMSSKISNFSDPNALLSGVESRTSSPIKIHRDDNFQSNIKAIYPCGEGAGYAGGITSAAMDGLKVAESILKTL